MGKCTTAVNLALALAAEGATVGMLDADIYGPSQPMMLGHRRAGRESKDGKTLEPMEGHGIQAMSIGFLIDIETPMVWRGPMVTQALEQLLQRDAAGAISTTWSSTCRRAPATSSSRSRSGAGHRRGDRHDAAGHRADRRPQGPQDVREGGHPDPRHRGEHEHRTSARNCGHEEHIFGAGGGERMGKDYGVELLGSLPLDIKIREQADSGKPTVVADPDSRVGADLPGDRAPGRGQDRREAAGPLGGVSQDRHPEHLNGTGSA